MRRHIKNRLIAYFLISILVPVIVIAAVVYSRSTAIIAGKTGELLEKNLDSVALIVRQRFEFINELTTLISINPMINQVLSADKTDDMAANITQILTLDKALSGYYLSNYYVLPNSSVVPTVYLIDKPGFRKYQLSSKVRDISELSGAAWLPELQTSNAVIRADGDIVIIARKLYDLKDVDKAVYAALLTIEINKRYFNDLLSSLVVFPGTALAVFDADGRRILSSAGAETVLPVDPSKRGGRVALSFRTVDSIGWTFASAADLRAVNADQDALTIAVVLLLAVCLVVALAFALVFSRRITAPISALVASMSSASGELPPAVIDYKTDDEFGYLVSQYHAMMTRIGDLIGRLYASESEKRKAELRAKDAQLAALQAQINPHFLYNTLDSINLHAQRERIPAISAMIEALADFYRYGLVSGRGVVTVEEELRHAESYLKIQRLRYGERLKYAIEVPFEIRKLSIVHFVLQPLVENAIVHGLQPVKGDWRITISAVADGGIVAIRIADDGAGADAGALNALTRSSPAGSFGIFNVHERISGSYGEGFGLSYAANSPRGIVATVRIPGWDGL